MTGRSRLMVGLLEFRRRIAVLRLHGPITGAERSGAYMAALAAQHIVATPSSIIGSIGVIQVSPRLPRLLDRLGVDVAEHRAGGLKGMGAPWRDESEQEAVKEQALIDALYDSFVERMAERRRMSADRARALATGEVWLGSQAVELGLADEVGDLERAVEVAAALARTAPRPVHVALRRPLLGRLLGRFTGDLIAGLADELEQRLWERFRL